MKNKTFTYLVLAPLERVQGDKVTYYHRGDYITFSKEDIARPGFNKLLDSGYLKEVEAESEADKAQDEPKPDNTE